MPIRHSRPGALPLSGFDFDDEAQTIALRTRDDCLVWWHFQCLFVPAGSYAQIVYFVPFAFRYLFERRPEFSDVIPSLVRWIAQNTTDLDDEGLLAPTRQNLLACLEQWTGDFHIEGTSPAHLRALFERPKNSEVVVETLLELMRHEPLADLAALFLRSLSFRSSSPFQLAWFLALSHDLPQPPLVRRRTDTIPLPADVTALLNDPHLRQHAAQVVLNRLAPLPDQAAYWDHLFSSLGIA